MTVSRPTDWSPLASSDPVPGEPVTITAEAKRLRDVATEIRSQIGRLRTISGDDTLKGQYAEKLRTAAGELAGQLEKTSGRYERVSGHLSSWAPELEYAQSESVKALQQAQSAEATRQANTVEHTQPNQAAPQPTPEQQEAERRRRSALDSAQADLAAAQRQLQHAIDHVRTKGGHVAGQIRAAIDDDVKDSWWDNVKDWVDRNKDWIKTVTDILSWVATALAVVALFIPGLNIIALLAIGLTVLVLAGHTLLAASGNGSWADVALDVFALATFGAGRLVTAGLRGSQAATRAAATGVAKQAAKQGAKQASSAARTAAGKTLANQAANKAQKRAARAAIEAAKKRASKAANQAAREVRGAPMASATGRDAVRAGSSLENAQLYNDIANLRGSFPGNQAVDAASRGAGTMLNTGTALWGGGTTADVTDKVLGNVLNVGPYNDAKDFFTKEVGSTW
jgi:hypothetical protein